MKRFSASSTTDLFFRKRVTLRRTSIDRQIRGSYASCDVPFGHIQTDMPNSVRNYDRVFSSKSEVSAGQGGEIMIQYGTEMKKVESEDGGTVCTSRLWEIADNIEVKHFAASLVSAIL